MKTKKGQKGFLLDYFSKVIKANCHLIVGKILTTSSHVCNNQYNHCLSRLVIGSLPVILFRSIDRNKVVELKGFHTVDCTPVADLIPSENKWESQSLISVGGEEEGPS